ncbi:MAG TPA: hypothetical protein VKD72_26530, partial [Gemmataceae bacterium]|nr:hypothetical protein [Gemmataceae bacterium]
FPGRVLTMEEGMNTPPRLVAHVEFTDGQRRPVWEDERGQYVVDEDGTKVRGVWLILPDEADSPIVVAAK